MIQSSSSERRRLLKVVGAFFLGQAFSLPVGARVMSTPVEQQTFAAFLDVLLPRDHLSGSAVDLKVDVELWKLAEVEPRFRRLVLLGCQWLNMTGGPPFAELTAQQQLLLVDWMSRSDWDQIPRRFYELVRQVAVEVYYSQPAAWQGMPLAHPPQPLGYPPPWQ